MVLVTNPKSDGIQEDKRLQKFGGGSQRRKDRKTMHQQHMLMVIVQDTWKITKLTISF